MQNAKKFDGADYDAARDNARLTSQLDRVFSVMKDGQPRTLQQIARLTGAPESSVSAQLRHLRKERFGGHEVRRRYLGEGRYEYQLVVSLAPAPFNPAINAAQ
jgi:DNA-binding Lrp family transcriptional regulator